jgi:hypothetical protein
VSWCRTHATHTIHTIHTTHARDVLDGVLALRLGSPFGALVAAIGLLEFVELREESLSLPLQLCDHFVLLVLLESPTRKDTSSITAVEEEAAPKKSVQS